MVTITSESPQLKYLCGEYNTLADAVDAIRELYSECHLDDYETTLYARRTLGVWADEDAHMADDDGSRAVAVINEWS